MTEFQKAIGEFLKGQLELQQLEAELLRAIAQDAGAAEQILRLLNQLFRASRLSARDFVSLKQCIENPPQPAPPPQVESSPPPVAEDAPSQAQGSGSDILDILGSPAENAPQPEIPSDLSEQSASETPSEDKTIFRQAAPPRQPPGQPSQPQTGTGSAYQTGPTGDVSRRTGGVSVPTGTGSSWTDPSKWGEGPAPTMQPGSILKDRYVLETVIGRGGMGVVFKAKDLRREEAQDRNPHIAVKILNDEFRRHPESLKALQRESRKAQDLAHPNIVTVFDFDRDGQIVYMTMEFLEGQSLDRLTKDPSFDGMPLEEAYPLIEGLGHALAYAHHKGVVHSDFKPANTFLTKDDVIKVFDFGIARAAKLPGKQTGEKTLFDPGSLGALTPAYASCEMIEGEEPDPRDDIYALACLSYELLTGRHPFDKRSATEARDKGLVPAPIKGISRRNWRGLQRGLAFSRDDRSPSIDAFLDDLKIRKLNKTTAAVGVAASLGLIAILVVQGPAYLRQMEIDDLIASIVSGDEAAIPAALERLSDSETYIYDEVVGDSQVEDRLIDFFSARIVAAEETEDYPYAEALLARAESLYDDSKTLGEARNNLEFNKNNKLAELDRRFNESLQAGRLMPSEDDNIIKVLEEYQKVQPDHSALSDARLPIAYADMAERLISSDVLEAEKVIREAQKRFPDDTRLIGLSDRVERIREVRNTEIRIAELEQKLSVIADNIQQLDDARKYESEVFDLAALDPSNETLKSLRTRFEKLAVADIDSAMSRNDWNTARTTLEAFSSLLSADFAAMQQARIDAAASKYGDAVDRVYASLSSAMENGDIGQASAYLGELEKLRAAPEAISQAREIVSRGYIEAVQRERVAGRFDEARRLVRAGQGIDPANVSWQSELDEISAAEQLAGQALAEQERQERQQQRQEQIDALTKQARASLAKSPFRIEAAQAAVKAIDDLARLDPSQELARTGRRDIAAKLATEAQGLAARDQKFDEALALIAKSTELLPAEQSLRQAQVDLQNQRREYLERVAEQKATELKSELERLLASPAYSSSWETDLKRVVQGLEPVAAESAYLSGKREQIAGLYVERAKALREEERFDLAETMLSASDWFVHDFAAANQERNFLLRAREQFESADRERQLRARVDGLKRTFSTELDNSNFQRADAALTELRKLLPGSDPFVVRDAPNAIADAYLKIAERRLENDEYGDAEEFVRKGLEKVADHPGLKSLLADIRPRRLKQNQAILESALKNDPPTDARRLKNLMAQVRADSGSGFADIEKGLMSIANTRVAGSKSDRDAVVAWLGGIFTNYAPPSLEGPACTKSLAGYGSRGPRAQCFDYLPGSSEEGPRLVVIPPGNGVGKPFAISQQELSVGQWNAYCQISGKCSPRTNQSESLPITNISVADVQAYAGWLSAGTKHKYRLPTDAEWEHAARSDGSRNISPNCINRQKGLLGDKLWEVGLGGENAWGLMNYIGNAQEWVRDPSGSYEARGGAYTDRLGTCSVELSRPHAGNADELTGFRLVRELEGDA